MFLKVSKNFAPSAPLATLWSPDRVVVMISAITISFEETIGFFDTAPVASIQVWGGKIIAPKLEILYMPRLLILNVPSVYSLELKVPLFDLSIKSLLEIAISSRDFFSHPSIAGTINPSGVEIAIPIFISLWILGESLT